MRLFIPDQDALTPFDALTPRQRSNPTGRDKMTTYTTSQAAKAASIAPSSIRGYTRNAKLSPYFSATATATPRQLTTGDVKLLRFIATATARGETLDDVTRRLDADELDAFTWSPPEDQDQEQQPDQQRAMIDPTMIALLETLRDEFTAARAHAESLQHDLIISEAQRLQAESELARVQQELDQLKTSRRSWWDRLRGR